MSCLVVDICPCQADIRTNQGVRSRLLDRVHNGVIFSEDKRGLLMVRDSFHLRGGIISCRDMQANAGIWCPVHLAKVGDF